MQHYDPLDAPDCEEWLALDEQERIALARDYQGNPDDLFKTARLARNTCNISAILLGEGWRKAVVNSRSLSQLIYSGLTPSTPLGWLGSAPYQTDYTSNGTNRHASSRLADR